ncbi:hypothetical protein ABG768_006671, partial [Culter alburnus]
MNSLGFLLSIPSGKPTTRKFCRFDRETRSSTAEPSVAFKSEAAVNLAFNDVTSFSNSVILPLWSVRAVSISEIVVVCEAKVLWMHSKDVCKGDKEEFSKAVNSSDKLRLDFSSSDTSTSTVKGT